MNPRILRVVLLLLGCGPARTAPTGPVDNGASDAEKGRAERGARARTLHRGSRMTADGWLVVGDDARSHLGVSVAAAGDVNGDGYGDVVIGADGETPGGAAFVYLGSAAGLATSAAWTAHGDTDYAHYGRVVAPAGDVNGDGYGDVLVGAPNLDGIGAWQHDRGGAYVYHGSATGLATTPAWSGLGAQEGQEFGTQVATAGDVNGDGYDDVIVGLPDYEAEGVAFLYLGSARGLATAPAWSGGPDQAGAYFGCSVAAAGDVNGDGFGDVVIGGWGSLGEVGSGRAWVFLGSVAGLDTSPAWNVAADQWGAYLGWSVAGAGDVDGDGYDDVLVGAPRYDGAAGRTYLYLGSASGLADTPAWSAGSEQEDAYFGSSVAPAGDVNGDGFADVVIGAYGYERGDASEGRASVYLGSPSGPGATPGWTVESDRAGARLGWSVAAAGDVDGDGYDDVLLGAPSYDDLGATQGAATLSRGAALFDGDRDDDGALPSVYGGDDCDDDDPTRYPGAPDAWYDGVDSDCAGDDDYDQDRDGHADATFGGDDCDDTDPTRHPGATELWYDGIDSDCAGDDDYDRDGDGHLPPEYGGDDCNDANPAIYPGAPDPWYNGVDSDCAGNDDNDQDGDTYDTLLWGGDDCDDTDPTVHPGATDTPDDGVDQDCDGADTVSGAPDPPGDAEPAGCGCASPIREHVTRSHTAEDRPGRGGSGGAPTRWVLPLLALLAVRRRR